MAESEPTCLGCGYSLTGLQSGNCPECSKPFDLALRETYGPIERQWLKRLANSAPPKHFTWIFAAILLPFLLLSSSPNGSSADAWEILYMVLAWFVIIPYFACFFVHLMARVWYKGIRQRLEPWRMRWFGIPLVLIAFYTMIANGTIFWIRWEFAKSGFAKLAASPTPPTPGTRVGTFWITSVVVRADGTWVCWLTVPDCYSDGWPTLERGPSAGDHWPWDIELSDGWVICWDPT